MSEREIALWLACLFSTDGSVKNSNHSHGLAFCGFSVDYDWLLMIQNKAKTIGIETSIKETKIKKEQRIGKKTPYYIWFNNPRKIALLFDKHNCEEWFNPRKWKRIKEALEFYKLTKSHSRYSKEEDNILRENLGCLSQKEIAKLLDDRDEQSVSHRKMYLKKTGMLFLPKQLNKINDIISSD